MLQISHGEAASVLDALAERSPEFPTALDVLGPIRCEGDPEVITNELVGRLQGIIGVEPTQKVDQFRYGVGFKVPKGFPVDQNRKTLAALLQQVLDSDGEVLTSANLS